MLVELFYHAVVGELTQQRSNVFFHRNHEVTASRRFIRDPRPLSSDRDILVRSIRFFVIEDYTRGPIDLDVLSRAGVFHLDHIRSIALLGAHIPSQQG